MDILLIAHNFYHPCGAKKYYTHNYPHVLSVFKPSSKVYVGEKKERKEKNEIF